MHDVRRLGLQVFAAPEGMTGSPQIMVKAREIDFVTSFAKNMQALLDIMGITRMIRKENGSALKVRTASGTLESGDVAPGEEIPLSQYTVQDKVVGTIKIKKYRKGVPLEAIAEKGYAAAVDQTDQEFRSDLRNVILGNFYDVLNSGSLAGHETTWQMAVSMAIGRVKDKFEKMQRTATGVAVFVNTIDLYKYLGGAQITTQTAFGMTYVEDYLGAGVMFISSKIPENTVVATPLNNLIAYYVDPADSEFVQAGLSYTVDSETGFIGFHAQGNYERAISDMFAIMGVSLMVEYLDAVANIAVGSADTQTLKTLTVTSAAGEYEGTTNIAVDPALMSMNNVYKYKEAASATDVTYGMDVKTWTRWDGESPITATNGNHITVVEADQNYKAVGSGDVVAVVNTGDGD